MLRISVVVVLTTLGASVATADSCLRYTDVVTLTGVVKLETSFGPPGYGEYPATDDKETYPMLLLSKPVCVEPGSDADLQPAESNQRKVQVILPRDGPACSTLRGKRLRLRGRMLHQLTIHHKTPLLVSIERSSDLTLLK